MAADVPSDSAIAAAKGEIEQALQTGAAAESADPPQDLQWLAEKLQAQEIKLKGELQAQEIKLKRKYAKQEIKLRREYAKGLLKMLAIQLAVADLVFVIFAWAGKSWDLSTAVINTWLAAVVVQVIGVVTVVTLHLFPRRDKPDGTDGTP
jgi:hypothetical protein